MPTEIPVNNLSEAEASTELAKILDAEPAPEDQLAHYHWDQCTAQRRQQLEQHIARLQMASQAPEAPAAPEPISADSGPAPKAGPDPTQEPSMRKAKKDHKTPRWTPQARFDVAIKRAQASLAAAHQDITDRKQRQKTQVVLSEARKVARETGFDFPADLVLPDLPDPHQGKVAAQAPAAPVVPPEPDPLPELAAGEWIPEPEVILPAPGRPVEPVRSPCADDCVHPDHHHNDTLHQVPVEGLPLAQGHAPAPAPEIHVVVNPGANLAKFNEEVRRAIPEAMREGVRATMAGLTGSPRPATTADLDARDHNPAPVQFPHTVAEVRSLALAVAKSLWPLCEALDSLPLADRQMVRSALDAIHARLQMAYSVVDETEALAERV